MSYTELLSLLDSDCLYVMSVEFAADSEEELLCVCCGSAVLIMCVSNNGSCTRVCAGTIAETESAEAAEGGELAVPVSATDEGKEKREASERMLKSESEPSLHAHARRPGVDILQSIDQHCVCGASARRRV